MTVQKHRTGRIEAVRYADEVLKRRSSGESLAWIYSDLAERKDVAVSYSAFTRWVKKLELGKLQVAGQTRQSHNCADPDSSITGRAIGEAHTDVPSAHTGGKAKRYGRVTGSQEHPYGGSQQPMHQHPKHARLGVPILPAPNSDPDCDALFGSEE